jgi:hypothetical protein
VGAQRATGGRLAGRDGPPRHALAKLSPDPHGVMGRRRRHGMEYTTAMLALAWVLHGQGHWVGVPMPDLATCSAAIKEAKAEFNSTSAWCRTLRDGATYGRITRLVPRAETTRTMRPETTPTVTAILVVWRLQGQQNLGPHRTMADCERAALEVRAADRWVTQAFCRSAEPEERQKYRLPEIVLAIRMTPLSSPIRVLMPDKSTCEQAVVEAKNELNPDSVSCIPKPTHRSESATVTIIRNMPRQEHIDNLCMSCVEGKLSEPWWGPVSPGQAK